MLKRGPGYFSSKTPIVRPDDFKNKQNSKNPNAVGDDIKTN